MKKGRKIDKNKTLINVFFIVYGLFLIAIFVTSTSYVQLAIASLLYLPLTFYYYNYLIAWPNAKKATKTTLKGQTVAIPTVVVKPIETKAPTAEKSKTKNVESVEIVDVDKRAFLKLIGATGFSFFLFSILTRGVENFFFNRNAQPAAGTGLTASPIPTDGYRVSEIDTGDNTTYYGFINKEGGWYIMKEDPTTGSFRYVKGEAYFSRNWNKRTKLKYDYFHDTF